MLWPFFVFDDYQLLPLQDNGEYNLDQHYVALPLRPESMTDVPASFPSRELNDINIIDNNNSSIECDKDCTCKS